MGSKYALIGMNDKFVKHKYIFPSYNLVYIINHFIFAVCK